MNAHFAQPTATLPAKLQPSLRPNRLVRAATGPGVGEHDHGHDHRHDHDDGDSRHHGADGGRDLTVYQHASMAVLFCCRR